ncbi:MAG TPA: hypothetical protein VFV39_01590 [Limnobacter sp.]|nr:hypothetical protein [Limnobacter sp.]
MHMRFRAKVVVGCLLAVVGLTGFSISTPMSFPKGKQAVATQARLVVTHATIKARQSSRFYDLSEAVVDSLKNQPGVLAYSVRRQVFGNQAWTLTLWEGESGTSAFVNNTAHAKAMASVNEVLDCARFLRVNWSGPVKDLRWEDVLARMEQESTAYSFNSTAACDRP